MATATPEQEAWIAGHDLAAEYAAQLLDVSVWSKNIGPARVLPVTPELRRAVAAYDQQVLVPLLAGATVS